MKKLIVEEPVDVWRWRFIDMINILTIINSGLLALIADRCGLVQYLFCFVIDVFKVSIIVDIVQFSLNPL